MTPQDGPQRPEPNRARVGPQTSYRTPDDVFRTRTCANCGDPILRDEPWNEEADPAWGDVALPVHEWCSMEQNANEGRR